VAERDAFGRESGEAAPTIGARESLREPEPEPASAPASEPAPDREQRNLGPGARTAASLVVALLIVAGITTAVIVGIGGKDASISSGGLSVASNVAVPSTASPQPATKPGTPAAQRSLIGRRALTGALQRLRGRGRLRLLQVAPDRVDAQLVTRAGSLRNVQVTADGALRDFGLGGSAAGGLPTIALAQVDAAAPGRIVRAAARRAGRKPSRVDYLVLLKLPTGLSWNVYFKPDSLHFMADGHGHGLIKP
jgi:hypothetical protein